LHLYIEALVVVLQRLVSEQQPLALEQRAAELAAAWHALATGNGPAASSSTKTKKTRTKKKKYG
jgi:hypothetical protein